MKTPLKFSKDVPCGKSIYVFLSLPLLSDRVAWQVDYQASSSSDHSRVCPPLLPYESHNENIVLKVFMKI